MSRAQIVGSEEISYELDGGMLRPVLIRRLGMPVTAFMAYMKLIEEEAKETKKGSPQSTFNKTMGRKR